MIPIAEKIWNEKYRYKDESLPETYLRVARALAVNEKDASRWEAQFFNCMERGYFIPAGRILAGAGTERSVTLHNCYVMGTIPDDLSSIFDHVRQGAVTLQMGGGIGMDFSTIRPMGAEVKGVESTASGPVSFMTCWDAMCKTMLSAGSRRGAMMGTLRIDHPDIELFIDAKRDPAMLRNFNVSVLVTDEFMETLEQNGEWQLHFNGKVYKTVLARELWHKILRSTYEVAEPGVIFIDRMNEMNNLHYCEEFRATNPCGEQPLPPYGACLLGSINLAALVLNPFEQYEAEPLGKLSITRLCAVVETAVRMLDNVIDVSNFPLLEQKEEQRKKRRIGLGITGLANALAACGLKYNSPEGQVQASEWMKEICTRAYTTSVNLAVEKGVFPTLTYAYFESKFFQSLPSSVQEYGKEKGLRNSHLISIAPTGTISLFAGNISSGIEPVFDLSYSRKVLRPDGSHDVEEVLDWGYQKWKELKEGERVSEEVFQTVKDLTPRDHLLMQAALQPYVDSSISKTINCPENISFEDFQEVYFDAYRLGLKGCTTYRPNAVTGSILSTEPTLIKNVKIHEVKPISEINQKLMEQLTPQDKTSSQLPPRDEALEGKTYKLKPFPDQPAFYITINNKDGKPFEIFFNSKNMESYQWIVALSRMISAIWRKGGNNEFILEELRSIFDPRGGFWYKKNYEPSLVAAIGRVIEAHVNGKVLLPTYPVEAPKMSVTLQKLCPKCQMPSIIISEGCETCRECGYSKC